MMFRFPTGLVSRNSLPHVYAVAVFTLVMAAAAAAQNGKASTAPPQYRIFDIGVAQAGDSAVQGFRVSSGNIAVGRSVRTGGSQAFTWSLPGGIVALPNLAARPFCVSNSSNDSGLVVGACATTLFGSSRLPTLWTNGVVSQLPMPAGETLGDANQINSSGVAVGSVNGGSLQKAVIYSGNSATYLSQTTTSGCFFVTAFGINDSGRVIGQGIDPNNAARNVGIVYDIGSANAIEVGALQGSNGALAFGVSNAGHVVGSSMLNQGSGLPFIWTQAGGMVAIPLPAGTTQASARAVNSSGWAVGTASSAFAIPFLFDGASTYRLADLIPAGTGWDLATNTSSSALGISENNVIVGTGVLNSATRAYAMVPVVSVSIGGRVINQQGYGIRNAVVTISGGDLSSPKTAVTGPFGYFSFTGVSSATDYTITIGTKNFTFTPPTRTVTVAASVNDLLFVSDQ